MKRIIMLLSAMLILCGCQQNKEIYETDFIEETTAAPSVSMVNAVPVYTENETDITETMPAEEYIEEIQTEYVLSSEYVYSEGDNYLRIKNSNDKNSSLLDGYEQLDTIILENFTADPDNYLEKLIRLKPVYLAVYSENYTGDFADKLMAALPECTVDIQCSAFGRKFDDIPHDEFYYYMDSCVYPHASGEYGWRNTRITAYFENMTDTDGAVGELSLYYLNGEEWQPLSFTDGSSTHAVDITVTAGETAEYILTDESFDYASLPSGIYKSILTLNGEEAESHFAVNNETNADDKHNLDFLTDEENAVFNAAWEIIEENFEGTSINITKEYVEAHTAEDYMNYLCTGLDYDYARRRAEETGIIDESGELHTYGSGRGSSVVYGGEFFTPVYESETEKVIKVNVALWHGDNPCCFALNEINLHMVMTENGWRFDRFNLWY